MIGDYHNRKFQYLFERRLSVDCPFQASPKNVASSVKAANLIVGHDLSSSTSISTNCNGSSFHTKLLNFSTEIRRVWLGNRIQLGRILNGDSCFKWLFLSFLHS